MNGKILTGAFALIMCAFLLAGAPIGASDADVTDPPAPEYCTVNYVVDSVVYTNNTVVVEAGTAKLAESLPTDALTPTGKQFNGWMYEGNIISVIPATTGQTYTVSATFTEGLYSVKFIVNGTVDDGNYRYGAPVTVPEITAPEGKAFKGWTDGINVLSAIPTVTGDVTYVAVFEYKDAATVTFKAGDAIVSTQTVSNVSDIIIPYAEGYDWKITLPETLVNDLTFDATAVDTPEVKDNSLIAWCVAIVFGLAAVALGIVTVLGFRADMKAGRRFF